MSGHAEHSDAVLVGLAQGGDREAFAELFRRHYPMVVRACAGRVLDAEEVAQAAFVRAFERIGLCQGEARFGAWVQVIARHLCADAARARARASSLAASGVLPLAGTGPDWPEEHALRLERVEAVRSIVRRLPRRQREVLVARDLEGRRPGEIAAALGVSLGAVDSLLLRARRATAAGYRTMAAESGMATTASSAAVAVATGGVAAAPTGPGQTVRRAAEAAREALASLSARLGAAIPGLPSGLELVAAAIAVVALAGGGGSPTDPVRPGVIESPAVVAAPLPGGAGEATPGLPGAEPVVPAPAAPGTPSPPDAPEAPSAPPVSPPAPQTNPGGSVLSLVDVEMAAGRLTIPWRPEETPVDGTAPVEMLRAVPERPGRAAWELGRALWWAGVHEVEDIGRAGWQSGNETWESGKETGRRTWREGDPPA